jgi:hypothetical protein
MASLSWYQVTVWDTRPIFLSVSLKLSSDLCILSVWSTLTRGWVYNLLVQVLLGFASAVTLGSKSRRTRDHILLSHFRLVFLFVASYDSQGYSGGGILTSERIMFKTMPPPHI